MFDNIDKPLWQDRASCNTEDPELWWYDYPSNQNPEAKFESRKEVIYHVATAVAICNQCPVKNQCLEMGLKTQNLHTGSIWGGKIYSERLALSGKRHLSVKEKSYNESWLRKGVSELMRLRGVK